MGRSYISWHRNKKEMKRFTENVMSHIRDFPHIFCSVHTSKILYVWYIWRAGNCRLYVSYIKIRVYIWYMAICRISWRTTEQWLIAFLFCSKQNGLFYINILYYIMYRPYIHTRKKESWWWQMVSHTPWYAIWYVWNGSVYFFFVDRRHNNLI